MDPDTFFKDKKILVIGLGMTGISAASMLMGFGGKILAIDNNADLDREDIYKRIVKNSPGDIKNSRRYLEIIINGGTNDDTSLLEDIGLIIPSPGIPGNIALFKEAFKKDIPIWDELELAWLLMGIKQKKNTIAVTGTNGKTTVVSLINKILSDSKIPSIACGNVGLPLLNTLQLSRDRKILDDEVMRVIEVSSFQLERIKTFKPHIGILLNVTSDHLDRHGNLGDYGKIKFDLFSNQDSNDIAILNIDDPYIEQNICDLEKNREHPQIIRFGLESCPEHDFRYDGNNIFFDFTGLKGSINTEGTLLKGMHNISNIIASMLPAMLAGVSPESIERSVKNYKTPDHRIEYLGVLSGIRCFNDSKSTNPDSTIAALQDFGKEVTLILGGKDKDMDFLMLAEILESKVNNLILIGEASSKINRLFGPLSGEYEIYLSDSLEKAVELSFKITKPGEVLLLSPACASMDMFRDYKDRGDRFKKLVLSYGKA
ncbi:MAG: UDP-N-acetylmuramoyl-L-alanine--D-glutamate ligase [Candidatus Humimicrobiaceae bacterium]